MNHAVRFFSIVAALAANATVFANEPAQHATATPAPAASAVNAPPAATAPAAAPATQPVAKTKAPVKAPSGYKVKVIDGETRFCRKDQPIGTRFPTEVCMTEAQYKEQERNRDSMRNEITDKQKSFSNTR